MIDYDFLHKQNQKVMVDNQKYEDKQPKLFRFDYEISYRDGGLNRVNRERKTCFIMGYSIEECRSRLAESCGDNPFNIESEGKICRVDGITKQVERSIFRLNGVDYDSVKEIKKPSMRKISNVDEVSNSISVGKVGVNTSKTPVIDKDRGENVK